MDQQQAASTPPDGEETLSVSLLKEQRELALACFILSATLSLAVLLSNFGAEPPAIGEAREEVVVHRNMLAQEKAALAANQKALAEVGAARDALLRVRAGR